MNLPRPLIALIGFLSLSAVIVPTVYMRSRGVVSTSTAVPVAADDGPYTIHGSALLVPNVMRMILMLTVIR